MNSSEKTFWKLIRNNLRGFKTRVENVHGGGFPDVYCCFMKIQRLMELKVEHPGNWVYFRSSQIAFFRQQQKQGSTFTPVAIKGDDEIILVNSFDVFGCEMKPYKINYVKIKYDRLYAKSYGVFSRPYDWDRFNKVLFSL